VALTITHQNASALFASDYFIFCQCRDSLEFNCVEREVATFALIASKHRSANAAISLSDFFIQCQKISRN
jgi:hypothetical protein